MTTQRATRREWLGLAVIALPCVLTTMDMTVLLLAVPSVTADLAPSAAQLLWIVDAYGFLVAGSLITMGTLGDRIGRRRLLLFGALAFGAASILAASARSASMLIAARALLGVAGATLAPSTLSLIRSMFRDPRERTIAISIWTTSFSAGAAIGPFVGGALLERFWWGSVFLAAVPVMVLLLALGPALLPEYRDPGAGRLDVFSALLSVASLLAVIQGLKRFAEYGADSHAFAWLCGGIAVGALFARRQRQLAHPLIDFRLFRAPEFSTALMAFMLSLFALSGVFLFVGQYLQLVLGLSPFRAGLLTVPSSIGLVAGSIFTPTLLRWMRPGFLMAGGLAVAALGSAIIASAHGPAALSWLVVGTIILSLGAAPGGTIATDLIVGMSPVERAGAASAISETSAELGGALGIAILGSIGTVVYRHAMPESFGGSVAPDAVEAARATLGGALTIAQRLPETSSVLVRGMALEAFTQALRVAAATGAGILLLAAALSGFVLRGARST